MPDAFTLAHIVDSDAQVDGLVDEDELSSRQFIHKAGAIQCLVPHFDVEIIYKAATVLAVVRLSIRLSLSPGSLPIDPVATYKSFSIAQRLGVIVAFLICSWWPLALGQAGIIFVTSDSRLGQHSTLQNVAVRVARHLFRTAAIFSIIALASAIGAVLFIVPGILIQSVTAFALPAAVIENLSITAGMRRSMKLTRGSFGKILVVYLIALLVLLALGLGALTVLAEGNSLLWLPIIVSSLWAIEILLTITLTLLYFHASQNGLAAKTVL